MSFFPFIDVEQTDESIQYRELPLLREFAIDFSTGNPIIENKTFKVVEENEALKVWIYRALNTERFAYPIYSWDFGTEVGSLINKGYTPGLSKSEVKRYIEEALLIHPYILEVTVDSVEFLGTKLEAEITINSVYGEVSFNV